MKSFRRSRTTTVVTVPSPSPSFDFDLGLDLDSSHGSSTPWRLEEIVARAGEEADQHFLEVSLDAMPDEVLALDVNCSPAEEDPESNLLANEMWEKSTPPLPQKKSGNLSGILKKNVSHELPPKVKINPVATNFSGKLKQFSQELTAAPNSRIKQFSQELKAEIKRISGNLGVGLNKDYGMIRNGAHAGRKRVMSRTKSGTQYALQGLQFISKATGNSQADALWKAVESRFHQLAVDGLLSREDFGFCIGMKDSRDFAKELFDALARRRGQTLQSISLEELREFWILISDQKFDSRLQIFFDMCDKNADGRISEGEVKEIIALSASANKLAKLKDQADEYAALIMEELDPDNLGYIEIAQLESLLLGEYGGFMKDPHTNYSQTLSQNLGPPTRRKSLVQRKTKATMYFVYENWQRMWVVALWIIAMAGIFTWKFLQYRQRAAFQVMGYCLCTAKGAAETLKLNMALILLPVCRNTITWLRSSPLGSAVPFDDNINFHKTIAAAIVVGVFLHAGLHLTCDFVRVELFNKEQFVALLGADFGSTKPSYREIVFTTVSLSGIFMVVLMCIAFVLATRWFRRNHVKLPWPFHRLTGFNAFWYSHHLFVLVYVSLLVHSWFLLLTRDWRQKTTWVYLLFPVLLYSGERTLRALRAGHYTVNIVKAAIYPGNVLALHMTKPPGFKYRSGMYLFLQCPEISTFEWHPFSITSSPGDDCVSVHIRTAGDWTLAMRNLFSKIMAPPVGGKSGLLRVEYNLGDDSKFPRLRIDGPYGAPAQDYRKYDVLLLIGLGIGATPFISILKDLLNTIKMGEQQQPQDVVLDFSSIYENPSPRKKRKARCPTNAYFCWVTKEQGSFDWFKGIMNEVAEIDSKAVIELHNYLTSVYEEGDARSALITMVQSLHHARNGVDIVSGTRVRTHFARPNWKKVFSRVANAHKGSRIGVFYCGPMILAKELKELAREYNHNSNTRFEFHKENF
ncbi:hypothetical protein GOP47_0007529 [Adiantum capillus-veneris]|uniref:Uncharacterized protein n=1 Tax=Adiantum capillus-veneris TaxID=13818 RepID=A0A9D4V1G3_ADICA|nr:hypothetical protein GOP47_0007529 [Adiantum capillus-veneris]